VLDSCAAVGVVALVTGGLAGVASEAEAVGASGVGPAGGAGASEAGWTIAVGSPWRSTACSTGVVLPGGRTERVHATPSK
jgi:hypothetical protein